MTADQLGFMDAPALPHPNQMVKVTPVSAASNGYYHARLIQPALSTAIPMSTPSAGVIPRERIKAIDLLSDGAEHTPDEQLSAWLALGANHLSMLLDAGWSSEQVLDSLRVVLQGVQGLPGISRRKLLELGATAWVSNIPLSSGSQVTESELLRITEALGKSIASSFGLFHRVSNAQILATGQAQLAILKQNRFVLNPDTQAMFYAPLYNLIGLVLHFQERYQEALQFHTSAHIAARESGDLWSVIQSLICQAYAYQSLNQFAETTQIIEAGLRLLDGQSDEIFIRAKAHLLGCWADSAMTVGEYSIARKKLSDAEAQLDNISLNEEFDRASWLQLVGKLALMMGDYTIAIHRCQEALQELPQGVLVRQTITLLPLAIAYARQREMDASLFVAEQAVPMLVAINAPMTTRHFSEYVQEDLLRIFPNEQRVRNFVAAAKNEFSW